MPICSIAHPVRKVKVFIVSAQDGEYKNTFMKGGYLYGTYR